MSAMSKVQIEVMFRSSPKVVYLFLIEPANIMRWFCDEVDINDNVFDFTWNGQTESAVMIEDVEEELVKFRWVHADDARKFWQFKISSAPITDETIVEVTEFCDEGESDDQKLFWTHCLERLRRAMGE